MKRKQQVYSKSLEVYAVIGANIARARRNAGLTQTELADMIGAHRVALVYYELGKTRFPLHKLERIAKALDIPIWDLLKRGGA